MKKWHNNTRSGKLSGLVLLVLAGCFASPEKLVGQPSLDVETCRTLAVQNSPLQQKKLVAESIEALQQQNIRSNNLPRLNVGGQATWQSEVFGFPIDNPLFQVPVVPKDQYKLALDVAERIWDGGTDKYLRQQRSLERELAVAQVDVDAFQLRELVTDLYFKALLLQEGVSVLQTGREDLRSRLKQAEASVAEGVALRTIVDQINIQILKTEQQIAAAEADKTALLRVLARWIGRADINFSLEAPAAKIPVAATLQAGNRPEYQLFRLQERSLQLNSNLLRLKLQPRVEAFAQGGFGSPNPFNFFETGFEPFALIGLRAQWTPLDWGNNRREREALGLQAKNIEAQRLAFEQRLQAGTEKDIQDVEKYRALLNQDDAIIRLQEDIVRRAEAQVKSGVMTATDYLAQLNILTQARLARKTHEVQAWQAAELLRARGE